MRKTPRQKMFVVYSGKNYREGVFPFSDDGKRSAKKHVDYLRGKDKGKGIRNEYQIKPE